MRRQSPFAPEGHVIRVRSVLAFSVTSAGLECVSFARAKDEVPHVSRQRFRDLQYLLNRLNFIYISS